MDLAQPDGTRMNGSDPRVPGERGRSSLEPPPAAAEGSHARWARTPPRAGGPVHGPPPRPGEPPTTVRRGSSPADARYSLRGYLDSSLSLPKD